MNHHHRKILHAIFAHPVHSNLDVKDVTHVFTGLGAEIDNKTGSRIGVALTDMRPRSISPITVSSRARCCRSAIS